MRRRRSTLNQRMKRSMLPSLGSATCSDATRKCRRRTQNDGVSRRSVPRPVPRRWTQGGTIRLPLAVALAALARFAGCRRLTLGYAPDDVHPRRLLRIGCLVDLLVRPVTVVAVSGAVCRVPTSLVSKSVSRSDP